MTRPACATRQRGVPVGWSGRSVNVARRGPSYPAWALQTLHALTQHFLAELAIFPFFDRDPELTLATLQRWSCDPSAHVRRLVS